MPLLFWRSIPELCNLTAPEQARFWKDALDASRRTWPNRVMPVVMVLFMAAMDTFNRRLTWWKPDDGITTLLLYAAFGAVWAVVYVNIMYRRARGTLRASLRAAGRCASCGYDLRGSPGACPEC